MIKRFVIGLIAIVCLWSSAYGQETYLHCGKLIDVVNQKVLKEQTIIVEDGRIKSVEKGYANPPASAQAIDLKAKTVMPGLIDMHVHLESETGPKQYLERYTLNEADVAYRAAKHAQTTLMAGFTAVRDLGGTGVNISLRNAINEGLVVGPRIFTSGKSIATTGGHADPTNGAKKGLFETPGPADGVADGPDACRQAVRQRYKNGADCIKITATGGVLSIAKDGSGPQFTTEELAAIMETAKEYGMHTAAHAHGVEGMKRAVEAGITTIEHGTKMTPEIMELMKANGTTYVPTISAGKYVAEKAKTLGFYHRLVVPKALEIGPQIQATFGKAYKAGVKIAFGTDAGVFPHGENGKEFGYMVEAGMPALEAIRAATLTAAEILGSQVDFGSIAAGKFADIVATDEDPTQNIATMEKVSFVMKGGVVYK